jgi:hypothetical protein
MTTYHRALRAHIQNTSLHPLEPRKERLNLLRGIIYGSMFTLLGMVLALIFLTHH